MQEGLEFCQLIFFIKEISTTFLKNHKKPEVDMPKCFNIL